MLDLASASAWDVATRYHEFKGRPGLSRSAAQLRRVSTEAILDRAKAIVGSVVHPSDARTATLRDVPPDALEVDLDVEETLEQSPIAVASLLKRSGLPLLPEEVWMSFRAPRRHTVILSVDTSLSMTGEKLALTAVALAVVLLQFPEERIGIVAFENEAQLIKRPDERVSIPELIERFLDVPAQGYTHLEEGMRASLNMVRSVSGSRAARPVSVVLLTDGKYTAGRDPAYLAPRFPHLMLLKMGRERASLELCREMARKGNGRLQEVGNLETLPEVMYGVVKDLLRGRSLE